MLMMDEIRSAGQHQTQKGVPVNNNNWEVVLPLEYSFLEAVRFLKAPAFILWRVFFAQISFLVVLFFVLLWYFNSQTIIQTTVSATLLDDSWNCEILAPRIGIRHYSDTTNENAQFAGSLMTSEQCVSTLEKASVCDLNKIKPFVITLGTGRPDLVLDDISTIGFFSDNSFYSVSHNNQFSITTLSDTSTSITRPQPPIFKTNFEDFGYNKYFIFFQNLYTGVLEEKYNGSFDVISAIDTEASKIYLGYGGVTRSNRTTVVSANAISEINFAFPNSVYVIVNGKLYTVDEISGFTTIDVLTGTRTVLNSAILCSSFILSNALNSSEFCIGCSSRDVYLVDIIGIVLKRGTNFQHFQHSGSRFQTIFLGSKYYILTTSLTTTELNVYDLETSTTSDIYLPISSFSANQYAPLSKIVYSKSYPKSFYIVATTGTSSVELFIFNTETEKLVTVNHLFSSHFQMLYSYGLCDGVNTNSFVNISYDFDYSVVCQSRNGFYYQSPNIYYPIPKECGGLQASDLLSNCSYFQSKLSEFVSLTCPASIQKLCVDSFDNNPPFSCTKTIPAYAIFTTITLAQGQCVAVWTVLSLCIGYYFTYRKKKNDTQGNESVKNPVFS